MAGQNADGPARVIYCEQGDFAHIAGVFEYQSLREAVSAAITKAPVPSFIAYVVTGEGDILAADEIEDLWWTSL